MINITYNQRGEYHDFTVERDGKFVSCLCLPKVELAELCRHLTDILNRK